MKAKLLYWILQGINTALAIAFLGVIFLGSPRMNLESYKPLNQQEVILRQTLFALTVALFFSLIGLLFGAIFKRKLSLDAKYLRKCFGFQFFLLILIYAMIYLFLYIKYF